MTSLQLLYTTSISNLPDSINELEFASPPVPLLNSKWPNSKSMSVEFEMSPDPFALSGKYIYM